MRQLLLPLVAVAIACSPTLPPPAVDPATRDQRATEQSQLLLYPIADGEALLGRAVQTSSDGSWTIADERAPGCDVRVTRKKAAFHSTRKVDAHSMTSLAASYAMLVSIEAKFGKENSAEIEIDNDEILHADTRGTCGEVVVDTVFIGHGKRKILAHAEASGGANIQANLVGASPRVDTAQTIVDEIDWQENQAYGFSVQNHAKSKSLELNVLVPSVVRDGDEVSVKFESQSPAWLVVYYIDSAGHGDVLWPSNEEPAPQVMPGMPTTMPSPKERAQGFLIKAALRNKADRERETLVVYGFLDKRDFDTMKPAAGSGSSSGADYASELTKRLQNVPMSRWSRSVVGYVIEPSGS